MRNKLKITVVTIDYVKFSIVTWLTQYKKICFMDIVLKKVKFLNIKSSPSCFDKYLP